MIHEQCHSCRQHSSCNHFYKFKSQDFVYIECGKNHYKAGIICLVESSLQKLLSQQFFFNSCRLRLCLSKKTGSRPAPPQKCWSAQARRPCSIRYEKKKHTQKKNKRNRMSNVMYIWASTRIFLALFDYVSRAYEINCLIVSKFNGTSTPKGSYSAKTGESTRKECCDSTVWELHCLRTALCESIRYQAQSEQNVRQDLILGCATGRLLSCTPLWNQNSSVVSASVCGIDYFIMCNQFTSV